MATTENTTKEKKMSKTVNIVAYLKADSDKDKREVMSELDSETDYYKTETREYDRWYLVTESGVNRIEEETYNMLNGIDSDGMMVCHTPKVKKSKANSSATFTSTIKDAAVDGVTVSPPGSDMRVIFGYRVKDDGRTIFTVRTDGPTKMGLLKHPSEVDDASDDDVWEDADADLWAVTVTCKVDSVDPTTYRWFDEKVIPQIKNNVAKHDWIQRTRVMDCSKEMTEEGACYDMF